MMMDKTNELLEELLAMIARSNRILMMVNIVNIATIITIVTVIIAIYFSINLVDPNINTVEHPLIGIVKAFFVYFVFIILNNIDLDAIIIMLVLFTLLVITSKFNSYYNSVNLKLEKKKNYYDVLFIIEIVLGISILLLLLSSTISKIGKNPSFSLYLNKCNL